MKVIDLIKNIQNENPIEKFKYRDELFVYDKGERDYECSYRNQWFFKNWDWQWSLNDEVEVKEEDKKIEKLDLQYKDITKGINFEEQILSYYDNLQYKINEIIDYINKNEEEKQ